MDKIRAACETGMATPAEAAASLAELLGGDEDPERFWTSVEVNLKAGKLRLIFVADEIPPELRKIVEFLNEQMDALKCSRSRCASTSTRVARGSRLFPG